MTDAEARAMEWAYQKAYSDCKEDPKEFIPLLDLMNDFQAQLMEEHPELRYIHDRLQDGDLLALEDWFMSAWRRAVESYAKDYASEHWERYA